jgi:hypothetical protein
LLFFSRSSIVPVFHEEGVEFVNNTRTLGSSGERPMNPQRRNLSTGSCKSLALKPSKTTYLPFGHWVFLCRLAPAQELRDASKLGGETPPGFSFRVDSYSACPRWTEWIAILLSTANTKVLVNGRPRRRIAHARGMRQGDPISPMLFVMVMEVLNANVFRWPWRHRLSFLWLIQLCATQIRPQII